MRFLALFFALIARPDSAPAGPIPLKNSPSLAVAEPGAWKAIQDGMEFRKLTLDRGQSYQMIDLKILRLDIRSIMPRVVLSQRYSLKAADVKTLAERSGAVAMINANYFDERGKPLGFLKLGADDVNGRVSRSSLFTGIFAVKDRRPFIVHRDQFDAKQADEGLQAGPLLLLNGARLNISRGAGKQSRRSLIGLDKERRLIVAVTDSLFGGLSWVELQEIFAAPQWQVGTTELLNLDGGGSAQLYVKTADLEEHVTGTAEIPVALGFFVRAP